MISVRDVRINCYLARPANAGSVPGLVLVHEWWGLNDWVRQQADRFARRGYAALAVDLYRGEVAHDREHAHELMRGLTDERALADMRAAFDYLAGPGSSAKDKSGGEGDIPAGVCAGRPVGVIGWCMGGGQALRLAIAEPRVGGTVVCYGRPVTDVEQLRRLRGPLLGIWGQMDRGIEVEPFRKALEEAGVRATQHVYPGAGHAFLNENNSRGYNAEQAAAAWKDIATFLDACLARPSKRDAPLRGDR